MPEHVPSTMHVFRGEKYRYFFRVVPQSTETTQRSMTTISHNLLYLEPPRGPPIRTRAEEELPGVIGGKSSTPQKDSTTRREGFTCGGRQADDKKEELFIKRDSRI